MLLDPSNTYFINNYIMIIITLTLSGRSVHVIEMSFFQGAIFFYVKFVFTENGKEKYETLWCLCWCNSECLI